jgi:hypothetical protein
MSETIRYIFCFPSDNEQNNQDSRKVKIEMGV